MLAVNFSCGATGLKSLFLRLFALPLAICSMWIFYSNAGVCLAKLTINSVYDNFTFKGRRKRILQQEWNDFERSWTKLRLRHTINDIHLYDLILSPFLMNEI